jgi:hypothetical protein
MGFDTSGGDPEAGGGGTIFDDPQFMESLQGVMQQQPQGGGYEQDPWAGSGGAASQEEMYRRPRRKYMGGGGGVYDPDFGDPRRAQGMGGGGGVISAPDGTVYGGGASSPFEVGGNSGSTKFKSTKHRAKLLFDVFGRKTEHPEDFIKNLWVVVAHSTTADFIAIHHHVVLIGNNRQFVLDMLKFVRGCFGHTKGVVAKIKFARFFVSFIKWKVNNPGKCDNVWIFETKVVGKRNT